MKPFVFNISLSVLNHLGRNLYRSFITVIGEAISNSWDADAQNVHITIDKENNTLIICDDGKGMTEDDFQNKFLKIGYSKRKDNVTKTATGRPFIGRKGIGKLALLSCAKKITILTKTESTDFVGGIIDNAGLDNAITDDVSANDYRLDMPDMTIVEKYKLNQKSGTFILFEDINDGIRNRIDYIRTQITLYFRFSLIDPTFNISMDGKRITLDELGDLVASTQLLWDINNSADPYVSDRLLKSENLKRHKDLKLDIDGSTGFIASVEKPSMLKIRGSDEKVSIDLYVNGRLREKDILKHIPTTRIVESYLYGQIHYNTLDDENDRFTSSREGVVSDDPKFKDLLNKIEQLIKIIIEDWDIWRSELNQEGDSENKRITQKERKSKELFNVVADGFVPPKSCPASRQKVEQWINDLGKDAEFNFASYGECFVSENLLRKYIVDKTITIPTELQAKIEQWRTHAEQHKNNANISFDIRAVDSDLSYCAMDDLAYLADDETDLAKKASLRRDAKEYKPIRDAMSHTSRLTSSAKNRLNVTYENVKARIVQLLNRV
jgi:Molecular chaperone, HSP90 family